MNRPFGGDSGVRSVVVAGLPQRTAHRAIRVSACPAIWSSSRRLRGASLGYLSWQKEQLFSSVFLCSVFLWYDKERYATPIWDSAAAAAAAAAAGDMAYLCLELLYCHSQHE